MSSNFKSVPIAHADPVRAASLYRLAIVGAGTLKGKEVAEVLGDRNFPSLDIKLLDDNDSLGQLESVGDEVSFIQSVRAEQFERVDFTFFASDQECTRHAGGWGSDGVRPKRPDEVTAYRGALTSLSA